MSCGFSFTGPQNSLTVNSKFKDASIDVYDILPDPELDQEADGVIIGNSSEFSASHGTNVSTGETYMELRCDHTAGVPINFSHDTFDEYPDSWDFVYFYQEFEWLYEEMPNDIELEMNFSLQITGDFANVENDLGYTWFKVYAWFIDSSGNWDKLFESHPPYTPNKQVRLDLNYFDIKSGFEGMVKNSSGIQEDPEDKLRLAIGLSPTSLFEQHLADKPWENYSGSVIARVTSMSLYIFQSVTPDPSNHLLPTANTTWGQTYGDVFPGIAIADNKTREYFRDFVMGDDGYIYVVGDSSVTYEDYVEYKILYSYEIVQKYDQHLNLIWSVENINRTYGSNIIYHNGYIYTVGYKYGEGTNQDAVVTKWTLDGQKVWQDIWGDDSIYDEKALAIDVNSDGSIYVLANHVNLRYGNENESFWKTVLLKYDSSGNLVWNQTLDEFFSWFNIAEIQIYNNEIFISDHYRLSCLDMDGNLQWHVPSAHDTTFRDGIFYTAVSRGNNVTILAVASDGEILWKYDYLKEYTSDTFEAFLICDITTKSNGNIVVLTHAYHIAREYLLLEFSPVGELLNTNTIESLETGWPYWGELEVTMLYSPSGVLYTGHTNYATETFDIGLEAFGNLPEIGSGIELIIIVGAIGGGVIVITIILYKKRST